MAGDDYSQELHGLTSSSTSATLSWKTVTRFEWDLPFFSSTHFAPYAKGSSLDKTVGRNSATVG
jgi:hypothetical protein